MSEFKNWNSYTQFAYRLRRNARFVRTSEDEAFLNEVLRTAKSRFRQLPASSELWRAQLGHTWEPLYRQLRSDEQERLDLPAAFSAERMKPLERRATEGRANPKGIPVLYLSTRPETAMSEVRPWLGSYVSCARFATTRALKIVDFSVDDPRRYMIYAREPDSGGKEEAVWRQLDRAFSEPMTSGDDTADYAPTQVMAEFFKNEGYDGVAYRSAFGDEGHNIALFNLADAEMTDCILHEVKSLKFAFEEAKDPDHPYWINEDGSMRTL